MIPVKKEGVLLSTTDLEFENEGVLNPAVIQQGDIIHLFYRAVRKGNNSTIGYCRLDGPMHIAERSDKPVLLPEHDYEKKGLEDPRIVQIDGVYYLTYIAYNGNDALGALALSKNLQHFDKQGIIVPLVHQSEFDKLTGQDKRAGYSVNANDVVVMDKDVVFFPRRINGKLNFLHRIKPDIQLVSVNELSELTPQFWTDYLKDFEQNVLLKPRYPHEQNYVGGGCPPVETAHGWLIIYHGVFNNNDSLNYSACAALMDLDDPRKEVARLPYPLFKPDQDYELAGDVDFVCFPTGTILQGDTLYIYYGAADDTIACASVSLSLLVNELLQYPTNV